jgi:hypothetical protein
MGSFCCQPGFASWLSKPHGYIHQKAPVSVFFRRRILRPRAIARWDFVDFGALNADAAAHFSEKPYVVTTYAGGKAGMRDAPPNMCGSMA